MYLRFFLQTRLNSKIRLHFNFFQIINHRVHFIIRFPIRTKHLRCALAIFYTRRNSKPFELKQHVHFVRLGYKPKNIYYFLTLVETLETPNIND